MSQSWLSVDDIAVHLGATKETTYASEKGLPARRWVDVGSSKCAVGDWVRGRVPRRMRQHTTADALVLPGLQFWRGVPIFVLDGEE